MALTKAVITLGKALNEPTTKHACTWLEVAGRGNDLGKSRSMTPSSPPPSPFFTCKERHHDCARSARLAAKVKSILADATCRQNRGD